MKIKVFILIIIILALVLNPVAYSKEITLKGERLRDFNRMKLSAELQSNGRWQAYEGFLPITEEQFLKKAGYVKEAEQVELQKVDLNNSTNISSSHALGWVLTIAGAGVSVLALGSRTASGGLALGLGGLTALSMGVFLIVHNEDKQPSNTIQTTANLIQYEHAKQIAEEYNNSLLEKLAADIE